MIASSPMADSSIRRAPFSIHPRDPKDRMFKLSYFAVSTPPPGNVPLILRSQPRYQDPMGQSAYRAGHQRLATVIDLDVLYVFISTLDKYYSNVIPITQCQSMEENIPSACRRGLEGVHTDVRARNRGFHRQTLAPSEDGEETWVGTHHTRPAIRPGGSYSSRPVAICPFIGAGNLVFYSPAAL